MVATSRKTWEHRTGCSKRPDFSPAQPWRLFHPPALSLPRQPLRPGTRLVPNKAAASDPNRILPSWLVYIVPVMARVSPPLHAALSPAHPLARRDVPLAQARALQFSHFSPEGNSQTVLHCAHWTSTVSSCAFCEQEGWSGCSPLTLLRPRVARAQGTHWAIPPLLACFFSILLDSTVLTQALITSVIRSL